MKVICDVCGTTIPETATHCPICGCAVVRPSKPTVDRDAEQGAGSNTYAGGGRFAKNNVRRNSGSEGRYSSRRNNQNEDQSANKGLIAVVIVLLVAIIVVVGYIAANVLNNLGQVENNGGGNSVVTPEGSSGPQGGQGTECTSVKLGYKLHEFTLETDQLLLSVEKEPANTTDVVTFVSADPEIATVDENGLVKPGTKQGQTTITVTCGAMSDTCTIISTVGELPEPPAPEVPEVNLPTGFILKLKTYQDSGEITLSNQWPTAVLYTETLGIKASDITWTTSDPSVAIVENGKAIGVDRGTCTITATIGDQTVTCKVLCYVDPVPETPYELSDKDGDMTITVGGTATLSLKDKTTGANVQNIEWQVNKEGYVEIAGNKITGIQVGTVEVYVVYEEITYKCIVRVTKA